MMEKIKLGQLLSKKMEVNNNRNCLSENTLSEFIENKLPLEEKERVFEHLNSCGDCYDVYKITSSIIADLKKVKKRNLTKSLSIAASIIFVFLIGFYYNNFYKPKSEDMQIYQKKVPDMESPSIKTEVDRDNSFSFRSKDKESHKGKVLPAGNLSTEEKKSEQTAFSISPMVDDPKNTGKTKRAPHKGIIARNVEQTMEDEETSIRRPKAPLKKSQKIKTTKIIFDKEIREVSSKKKSDFLILLEQGYVYKEKNHFGDLTKDKVLMLLANWTKLIPDLKGNQQDIALETIDYLKKRKREMTKNK